MSFQLIQFTRSSLAPIAHKLGLPCALDCPATTNTSPTPTTITRTDNI
jgi:hypothetical protein